MSELAIFDSAKSLPAHIRNLGVDETTKALMGSSGGGRRISIEGGVWRLMANGQEVAKNEERSLNVVIVAAAEAVSRTYYNSVYQKGVAAAPLCWSPDGKFPAADAKEPQSKSCADCPQNIKGSGQGESRACRFSQRIAVVLENDIEGDIYQMQLPATSIFGEGEPGKWPLQTYARMIGTRGVPIVAVVTEMRFDTASSTPKVVFKPVRVLEEHELEVALSQGKTEDAKRAITMTVFQTDGISTKAVEAPVKVEEDDEDEPPVRQAKPTVKPRKPKPAPEPVAEDDEDDVYEEDEDDTPPPPAKKRKPAPVVEADDEDEEEAPAEPVRRPSKKQETAATRNPDVLSVLDEWDD